MSELFSFGAWVRQRRRALDLTRDELAGQVGCAVTTIRHIETDERRPSKQLAARLADGLQISVEERPAFLQAARGELATDRLVAPSVSVARSVAEVIAPAERVTPALALPSGTVTFLFTDIEASTRLWIQNAKRMGAAIARHEAILREVIAASGGVVFKTVGDATYAAFASALDAVQAAVEAQRAVEVEPWGTMGLPQEQPLRVRMALHSGVVEERGGDYFGLPLSRIARLLAAGHGGQILLSQATQELVREQLAPELTLRHLGRYQLKDLIDPQHIFQLIAPNLVADFPPLRLAGEGTTPPAAGRVRMLDWGEAPDIGSFHGRTEELATLRSWIGAEGVRLVALLGMGGIGKTSLAAQIARELAAVFEVVYWRSLRNAPPLEEWLAGAIGFLSEQQLVAPPAVSERMLALLQLLRARRCLLILDNSETLFEPGQEEGRYRVELADYGRLLQTLGEASHQSCLLLTSREAPLELAVLGNAAVRSLQLGGLGVDEAQALLASKQLVGSSEQWAELCARFGGNGLALNLVGERICELFGGDLGSFLVEAGSSSVFGGIRRLLDEQVERSSAAEQQVLRLLAVEREGVRVAEMLGALGPRVGRGAALEAVEGLRRRSLIERAETQGAAAFTLQSVVQEYVTDCLVAEVADEIARGEPVLLVEQPLIKALAKDYVRHTQERLIGAPILQQLKAHHAEGGTAQRLLALLEGWRAKPAAEQGYGPGNVVNLLRLLRGELCGLDLSRLALRQAYLAEADAQDTSLMDAQLTETVLAEAFHFPGSVALSGDGALLAAGTTTGQVWLWRVTDRTALWAVQGHTGGAWSVALSADGHMLASGGEDGTVRLWEVGSGRPLATLSGHTGGAWSVALSADGQLLASGGTDGAVKLWETSSGRPLATLQGHTGSVSAVALSADGQLLASGGEDGTVRLWETSSGRPLATLQGHTGAVGGVALSADGQLLASSGMDGTVRLWDAGSGRLVAILQGHTGKVWGVALSTDGQLLASGGEDGTVRLWEISSGRQLAILQGHTGAIWIVRLSADGQLLASGGTDGTVRLWEAGSGRLLATLQGHIGAVWRVALSADGQLLASGGGDGTVRLWEASSGRQLTTLQGPTSVVWGVALSADGQLVASGGTDGAVKLWETSSGRPLATLQGHTGSVSAVALSADGQLLASSGTDGTVRLWETSSGRPLATLSGHTGAVWGVALSADGQLVASGGTDGAVKLWETSSGRPLATLQGHTGAVSAVALSADGRLVASGGTDRTVRLWEAGSGRLLATLQGHTSEGEDVALSADGQLLASSGMDGTVKLWETSSGRLLATLQGHTSAVGGVALSADGQLVVSGSFDGTVKLWEAKNGTCLRTLRAERRYERMDITGITGITDAQRAALLALGAVEHRA